MDCVCNVDCSSKLGSCDWKVDFLFLTFLEKADIVLPTMKTYKVPVVYQMYGYVEVEADSLSEAVEDVASGGGDMPLPEDASYVEGSFEVDYSAVEVSDESWNN